MNILAPLTALIYILYKINGLTIIIHSHAGGGGGGGGMGPVRIRIVIFMINFLFNILVVYFDVLLYSLTTLLQNILTA